MSGWLLRPIIGRFIQWTSSVDRYQSLIWVSAIGFALLHFSNYPLEGVRPQTVIAILFPHLVAGLLLSWTSQWNGLRWSIYLHILNNALPALFVLKERSLI
ncbi:CPBP family glutamic-type intramembrane protease [Spirosoma flavum]|uniref:Type II CAAX prenyl endopeptidase Rce1 family protein n=1 Tax=Spirosoma flavum TaxID=2048557 RepID=A0ABW6AI06_9BACT